MKVETIVNSLYASTSNIIVLPNSRDAWLVDCGDAEQIVRFVDRNNLILKGVMLTHGHFDHMYGLNRLAEYDRDLKVLTNDAGKEMIINSRKNLSFYNNMPVSFDYPDMIETVGDKEKVELGAGIEAEVIFTPGHNPSCISWIVGDIIFTGDSYIPGLKTVTNLPKSNKSDALKSERLILSLAEGRTIIPGHIVPAL